jgi:hypothetical protein
MSEFRPPLDPDAGLHPLEECARVIEAAIAKVADTPATFLPTDAKARTLAAFARIESQVAGLKMRIMPGAEDVAAIDALRDVPAWVAYEVKADVAPTRALHRLAVALDDRFPTVATALVEGRVNLDQARVIVHAVDALPTRVGPQIRTSAEQTLVDAAEKFRPGELRIIGRRILAVVAPEIADAEDARKLDQEERDARDRTKLTIRHLDNGLSRLSGLIPTPAAKRLETYLDAYTSPRHHDPHPDHPDQPAGPRLFGPRGEGDRIPAAQKRAHALCALLEHLDPAKLPEHGGDATTVLVTVDLDALRTELATAGILDPDLEHGPNLTAAHARRLACQARIIPVVLGGDSEVLDLGRSRRLFSPAQRKAIRLRDKRCRAKGCTVKAQWTEIHHLDPWANGGTTTISNGVCLCPWHHHRIEDPANEHQILPDGDILITKRRRT